MKKKQNKIDYVKKRKFLEITSLTVRKKQLNLK